MSPRADLVHEVLRHLRPLVLSSARVVEAGVRGVGWTVGSRAVVEVLREAGAATVPDIARRMDLPRQAVQRHVNDLATLGHVEQRTNPAHRRSVLIALTPDGAATFDRVRTRELRDLETLAAGCSTADLRTAAHVLAVLDRDVRARAAQVKSERSEEQR